MTSGVQTIADRANKSIPEIVVCGVILLMVLSQFSFFWNRTVFGQDDMTQIESYYGNVESEGRWLIYLLFPMLRYFNAHVALVADFVCVGVFGYVCARKWLSSSRSLLISLLVLLTPSIAYFFDWPIIALPSMLLLAVAALVGKRISLFLFFVVFGVLFNATYSNVYFLLPLLFLNENSRTLLIVLLYWFAGYMIGFVVAELVTWVVCGHLIELAEWRNPHYIKTLQDVLQNGRKMVLQLESHLRYMGKIGAVVTSGAVLGFIFLFKQDKIRGLMVALVIAAVMMSTYAQAITAGVDVSLRTAHGLYMGLFVIAMLGMMRWRKLLIFGVLLLAFRCVYMNSQHLQYQNELRSSVCESIERIGISSTEVEGIILLVPEHAEMIAFGECVAERKKLSAYVGQGFSPWLWIACARTVGFKQFWVQEYGEQRLNEIGVNLDSMAFETKGLYRYTVVDNHLVVALNLPVEKKI